MLYCVKQIIPVQRSIASPTKFKLNIYILTNAYQSISGMAASDWSSKGPQFYPHWRQYLRAANEVFGKVMFLQACVSHSVYWGEGGFCPGVSLTETPWTEIPWTENPQTETPLDKDLLDRDPWIEAPLDRDPLDKGPWTETPDRDPSQTETLLGQRPRTATSGRQASYWNTILFWLYFLFSRTYPIIIKCVQFKRDSM